MTIIQILSTVTAFLDQLGVLVYIQAGALVLVAVSVVIAIRSMTQK